jgi:hypothetical protein
MQDFDGTTKCPPGHQSLTTQSNRRDLSNFQARKRIASFLIDDAVDYFDGENEQFYEYREQPQDE